MISIQDLQSEYEVDVTWDEFNAPGVLQHIAYNISKYQKYYFEYITSRHKIEEALGNKYQELYLFYKLEFDVTLKDSEIKTFIETDKEYLKLKSAMSKIEAVINYIEECMKNLNSLRWDIKTFLDLEKFKAGIV